MKENNMTTIIVHNILTSQMPNKSLFNDNPIINMQYQYGCTPNYSESVRQRIRSRSFYDDKKRVIQQGKRLNKNRTYAKFAEKQEQSVSQPKVIDLQFQSFSRSKKKKDSSLKSAISTHEYYSLMVDSMQTYIKKIEKGKQKRLQKCEKLKSFGVNIQSIKVKSDSQRIEEFTNKSKLIRKQVEEMKETTNQPSQFSQIQLNESEMKTSNLLQKTIQSPRIESKSFAEEVSQNNFTKVISAINSNKKVKFLSKKLMFPAQKKDESRNIASKLKRMYLHFSIILNSFGVFLDRTEQKNMIQTECKGKKGEKKYTYYVGRGNNKNLIVSILKKRWWWAEAQDISSANFVWTQLKIVSCLQRQASMAYSQLEQADPTLYRKGTATIKQRQPELTFQLQKARNLFHSNHAPQFYNKLSNGQQKKYLRSMKVPSVVHNHYEANYMLGNKKALFYNMVEYKNFKNQSPFEYMPFTYHIEKINSRAFKQFEKKAKQDKKSLWIVKPGQNSNRGQGIFVSDSFQAIKSKIQKNKKHTFIIQKYIKNNLTFQRRKFDIRTYVLMASIGKVQKFYWYSEGYLRTASEIYDLSDLDDPFIHLTNDAIQSTGDNYGKFEKGNKITYSQFQRYLDLNYPNEKYLVSHLVDKMKGIAKEVVQATYFKIDPCRKQYSFQLFGLDFLVDTMFRPWLLEVNTNPCLELSSPVLERLIPRLIQNLFRIVVDPVFEPFEAEMPRNLACYIPENIIDSNRFELIFDSLHDRDQSWQQFSRNQNTNKIYEDQNEQFQNDGEIIKIQD